MENNDSNGSNTIRKIIFDLVDRYGLVVIALLFLGYLILLQREDINLNVNRWVESTNKIETLQKEGAERFTKIMIDFQTILTRIETNCKQPNDIFKQRFDAQKG